MKPQIEPMYRPDEVASALGWTIDTVLKWAREDRIKHAHFPGGIRIPMSEVKRIIAEGVARTQR